MFSSQHLCLGKYGVDVGGFLLSRICLESLSSVSWLALHHAFLLFVCKLILYPTLLYKMCFKFIVYLYFVLSVISKATYTWSLGSCFSWPVIDHWWTIYNLGPPGSICASASMSLTSLHTFPPWPTTAVFYSSAKDSSFCTEKPLDISIHYIYITK